MVLPHRIAAQRRPSERSLEAALGVVVLHYRHALFDQVLSTLSLSLSLSLDVDTGGAGAHGRGNVDGGTHPVKPHQFADYGVPRSVGVEVAPLLEQVVDCLFGVEDDDGLAEAVEVHNVAYEYIHSPYSAYCPFIELIEREKEDVP